MRNLPNNGAGVRILLVEDEAEIAYPLSRALRRAGFETLAVRTGAEALAVVDRARFDLALVNLELPDRDAHLVCRELHRAGGIPVVMLADSVSAADRDAWRDGAEDYLVKPSNAAEVVSRIRAVLRRTHSVAAVGVRQIGPLTVDLQELRAELAGVELTLSPKEAQLLIRLVREAGRVLTRKQLMDDVWGPGWFGSAKTLDVHIGWLRRKLGDDHAHPRFIHTVRGVGFRFASPEELDERGNGDGPQPPREVQQGAGGGSG